MFVVRDGIREIVGPVVRRGPWFMVWRLGAESREWRLMRECGWLAGRCQGEWRELWTRWIKSIFDLVEATPMMILPNAPSSLDDVLTSVSRSCGKTGKGKIGIYLLPFGRELCVGSVEPVSLIRPPEKRTVAHMPHGLKWHPVKN